MKGDPYTCSLAIRACYLGGVGSASVRAVEPASRAPTANLEMFVAVRFFQKINFYVGATLFPAKPGGCKPGPPVSYAF